MARKRKVNGEKPPRNWLTKLLIKRITKTLNALFIQITFVCFLVVLPNLHLHQVLGR